MDKRLIYPSNAEGKRDAFFVREDRSYLLKHASEYHPQVAQYIAQSKPIENLIQVLLTGLGCFEFWGQNVNGDQFPQGPLSHEGTEYGYKTFETFANYFVHHINKNPALAKGKVLRAFWNDKAKRVELAVGIDPALDPEAGAAIDRGEDLAFSMGCKVPYDVCSICGNKAKTRENYCEHLRYMMNQIDPASGKIVGAVNTLPRFFDISRVLIPADKTAYMWTKIASASPFFGVPSSYMHEALQSSDFMKKIADYKEEHTKKSSVNKISQITKRIPLVAEKAQSLVPYADALLEKRQPKLPKEALAMSAALPTLLSLGVVPTPEEFQRIILEGLFKRKDLADTLPTFKEAPLESFSPEYLEKLPKVEYCEFNPEVARVIWPFIPERSYLRPHLTRRLVNLASEPGEIKEAEEIRTLVRNRDAQTPVDPMTIAGILAALYALMGPHTTGAPRALGRVIADHPFLALSLGAGLLKGMHSLKGNSSSGFYDLDDPNRTFYNNDWQSRFARMQARPVTVIKTGAAPDTQLAKKILYGVPAIYLGTKAMKYHQEAHPEKRHSFVARAAANNPEILSAGLILDHMSGKPISKHVEKLFSSSKKIVKTASVFDMNFVDNVPDEERELVSDLAILWASDLINKKILGGA